MILGFEHFAIAALDSKALADWYIKLFGMRVVYDNGKQPPTFLLKAPDGMVLEILPATSGAKTDYSQSAAGFRHLAVTVDDYAAAESHLRAHGITEFIERRETEASKLLFFRDPEGNILHLMWREKTLG
jgi:catechol 2,3-dioxygenase-like lactoylglutathione lyase family enzyme